METVKITREKSDDIQTLGRMFYNDKQICCTLELPWKENRNRVSCIPKEKYRVIKRWSKKYGWHFHILDVPNRSYILIHHGNYFYDFLGCIGVGEKFAFINKDAHLDITSSKATMKKLLKELPDEFDLIIE